MSKPEPSLPQDMSVQANACHKAFREAGLKHVYNPESKSYQERISSYWSVSAQLKPICVVQPTSTEDVVKIIKTLVQDPVCAGIKFAVRGGGHMSWAGSNNIDNGVTIDLGLMNSTALDKTSLIASIGPGSRWGEVYAVLDPLGYTVVGGRASSVGVPGFLTGGGNSYFTAQYGFATDTVKNFEVVLASGEVVNANSKENGDLFQVMKGGVGSNYGIVTRFDMQALAVTDLWGGTAKYDKATGPKHVEAHIDWVNNLEVYPQGSTLLSWSYMPSFGEIVIINVYHDTAGNIAPPAFDKFMAIEQTFNTFRTASHKSMADELEQASGYRNVWFTTTVHNDIRIYNKIVELHEQMVDEWKGKAQDPDFITQCVFQAIPTSFSKHSVANGGNIMGLDREKENVVMILFDIAVKGVDLEIVAQETIKRYGAKIEEFAASVGGLADWKHLNYAGGFQDPLASYGEVNVAKMRAASTKYDPNGVFQNKSPGGFKISRSSIT